MTRTAGRKTKKNAGTPGRDTISRVAAMGLFPAFFYLVVFAVVTWPLLREFSTSFFTDERDGLVMVWNVWWTNEAVTNLHASPWFTNYIHYPHGVTLLAHTLCPFNGFLGVVLLPFLSLVQTYNFIVVFTFVAAGLTAFWLSYYISRAFWPSIAAGFIYSFSNYHFAHMLGHLNLSSLEWIPLFVLCWYVLLNRPGILIALASSVALFAVFLCDYYYFFYCFLIAVLTFAWHVLRRKDKLFFLTKPYVVVLGVFAVSTALTSGVFVAKLWRLERAVTFVGVHDPQVVSTDLLSPFVYGACLRFSHLTRGFWSRLPGNTSEFSVYMGLSVVFVLVYAWIKRNQIKNASFRFWYVVLLFFLVMSLGAKLHVWGRYLPFPPMPYLLMENVFPLLKISGAPGRMMVVVMLCAAVLCALGFKLLLQNPGKSRVLGIALLVVLFFEFLPFGIKPYSGEVPRYVNLVKDLPPGGGVVDVVDDTYHAMFYQTIHDKPVAFGKIARLPQDVYDQDTRIYGYLQQGDMGRIYRDYNFRYIITQDSVVHDLARRAKYK